MNLTDEGTILRKNATPRFAFWSAAVIMMVGIASCARADFDSGWGYPRDFASYALDGQQRLGDGKAECDPGAMVRYSGTNLRYSSATRVHPAFVERLPEFERVVSEVAIEFYGRAPSRVLQMGAYNCRSVRGNPNRLSEHALGNALDVRGFRLPAMRRAQPSPEGMPRQLRRGFDVTVLTHWDPQNERDTDAYHARFLRAVIRRLVDEDVFRVIYGPAHPGHRNHFHFDMSRFRWIHV